jgi:hypothetical protein
MFMTVSELINFYVLFFISFLCNKSMNLHYKLMLYDYLLSAKVEVIRI